MQKYSITIITILMLLGMVFLGNNLYHAIEDRNDDRINRDALQAVITELFTCPDDEMIALFEDMYRVTNEKMTQKNEFPGTDSMVIMDGSKIEEALERNYKSYFTEKGYASFAKRFLISYSAYSTSPMYQVTVDKIDITRSKDVPTNYSFTATLTYGPLNDNRETTNVEGNAQFYEQIGKLSYLKLVDNQLLQTLQIYGVR